MSQADLEVLEATTLCMAGVGWRCHQIDSTAGAASGTPFPYPQHGVAETACFFRRSPRNPSQAGRFCICFRCVVAAGRAPLCPISPHETRKLPRASPGFGAFRGRFTWPPEVLRTGFPRCRGGGMCTAPGPESFFFEHPGPESWDRKRAFVFGDDTEGHRGGGMDSKLVEQWLAGYRFAMPAGYRFPVHIWCLIRAGSIFISYILLY
jgi:hypothetical protein